MIPTQTLQRPVSLAFPDYPGDCKEISRLLAAAVVNYQFRQQLLTDPEQALLSSYCGETFSLAEEERDLLLSIRADTLSDLAGQLTQTLGIRPYTYPTNSAREHTKGF